MHISFPCVVYFIRGTGVYVSSISAFADVSLAEGTHREHIGYTPAWWEHVRLIPPQGAALLG
jgi:hypothetical protein